MLAQVLMVALQERAGPTFFLPQRAVRTQTYNYHPPMPLPDPEAPEQTLGDCAICMDAIEVDPGLRRRRSKSSDGFGGEKRPFFLGTVAGTTAAKKSYSLAPCHHLFVSRHLSRLALCVLTVNVRIREQHTACLERWLAIKVSLLCFGSPRNVLIINVQNICPQCRRPLPPL